MELKDVQVLKTLNSLKPLTLLAELHTPEKNITYKYWDLRRGEIGRTNSWWGRVAGKST